MVLFVAVTVVEISPELLHREDFIMLSLLAHQRRTLQIEKDALKHLLYTLMPQQVADSFCNKSRTHGKHHYYINTLLTLQDIIAYDHQEATVIFIAFDSIPCASATDMVSILSMIFVQVDELCARRNIYKTKTIGASVMLASGIPRLVCALHHRLMK